MIEDEEQSPTDLPDTSVCGQCGSPTEWRIVGLCQGMYCPRCDEWSMVTTYWPEILGDQTEYRICLPMMNSCTREQLQVIARVSGKNYLELHKLLAHGPLEMYKGKALSVLKRRRMLSDAGLSPSIAPDFDYADSELEKYDNWLID